jgi:hypothetical protein
MNQSEIKLRYNFAMSSFTRMYGIRPASSESCITRFCHKWSKSEEQQVPLGSLTAVDFYFKDLWEIWGGYL